MSIMYTFNQVNMGFFYLSWKEVLFDILSIVMGVLNFVYTNLCLIYYITKLFVVSYMQYSVFTKLYVLISVYYTVFTKLMYQAVCTALCLLNYVY